MTKKMYDVPSKMCSKEKRSLLVKKAGHRSKSPDTLRRDMCISV